MDMGVFMTIDTNRDMSIDKTEALGYLANKLPPSQIKDMSWFNEVDANNDGLISPHEFDSNLSS